MRTRIITSPCFTGDKVIGAILFERTMDGSVNDKPTPEALWERGVALYDEQKGIGWRWQAIDGAKFKAPMGEDGVGRNPTDRGKKWHRTASAGG